MWNPAAAVAGIAIVGLLAGCGSSADGESPPTSDVVTLPVSPTATDGSRPISPTATTTPAPGMPDQTGVRSTWIKLSDNGPLGVLYSRLRAPDGRIRITWVLTEEAANEFCQRSGFCPDGPGGVPPEYPAAAWALVDCQNITMEVPAGPGDVTATYTRIDENTWQDITTGAIRGASEGGGGSVLDSKWNAACNPEVRNAGFQLEMNTPSPEEAATGVPSNACPPGRAEVAAIDRWRVCVEPGAAISDEFALTIANRVTAAGSFTDVPSPNGGVYYFRCLWDSSLIRGPVNMLRCGWPPTNIVGGDTVDLMLLSPVPW